jgi:hypothetical protein
MKNKLSTIVLAALMLLSFNSIKAQHLSVDSLFNWPDTVHCFNAYSNISVAIRNVDTIPFTGTVSVYSQDTSNYPYSLITNANIVSLPADSIRVLAVPTHYFNNTSYAAGHDVVIVWPKANNLVNGDTLHTFINLVCVAGIPVIPNNKAISLFPNPANDRLFFDSKYSINDFEYVRIIDVVGEEQCRFIPNENSIPIKNLSPGMYFIEVKLKDGTVITEKFIRE